MTIEDQILANPVLREVNELLQNQTAKGLEKYGTTVNPMDYTTIEWIEHAIQESMDKIVYLTVLKQKLEEMQNERY
ncbi:hypothetical protein [Lysinibacillus pakistanensis]|uniref:Uncharacterized protein n=1 Tax=Lysinibacillus pakistanensis TaxID=759811 RepID=A0AAX3WVY2_9BACI|nr:hypothetical protein [Lysinibacillus pakistanensis]MDM5231462.1 hypothetical protein [Lysinibacillus pakistanensis]WHY47009.1 hypothetical protein QNH22_01975 [Lysinibacillus pakistanensis]WHY52021.1 hypothetical protein QNH24_01970 [Lysinibacillus pakistanensis]